MRNYVPCVCHFNAPQTTLICFVLLFCCVFLCLLLNSGNGVGGESIYGAKFEDESFDVLHNKRYLVSMANMGPNTNGSQFFINTVKTSWLDGKNVVFGMVMQGSSVVDKIEKLGTNSGTPKGEVVVIDSGEI